jgi:DNA-binding LytR/AlgR family response regulator
MKILAIDNEPRATRLLEEHCRAILTNRLERFTTADSLPAATTRLSEASYDVVLLDPQLPRSNGLDLLASQRVRALPTIIVSARTDLALRAFDYGVIDFVAKPVNRDRLAQALERIKEQSSAPSPAEQYIAVRRLGRIELIAVDDLLFVEGADKYSELVLANGQRNFHDKGLGQLATTLPPVFVRIHKSYLVRFAMISRLLVQKGSRYFVELKTGLRLPVGRTHYQHIKARLI